MDFKVLWLISSFWTLARSQCQTDKAIQGTKACGTRFRSQLSEKQFNATNPDDLHEACCTMDFLERCLHKASGEAGCREEVSALVHTLLQTAKDLLGDVYNTNCKYDCSAAAPGLHVPSAYLALPSCLLLLVYNLKWTLS
ncbi:unnamed protein product [Ixodes persulcatus]